MKLLAVVTPPSIYHNNRYKLGPMRADFFLNLDPECNYVFSVFLYLSSVLGILLVMVLVGPRGTNFMARVIFDTTLGRGRGGTNNNDRDPGMITCQVLRVDGGGGGFWWRIYDEGMMMYHGREVPVRSQRSRGHGDRDGDGEISSSLEEAFSEEALSDEFSSDDDAGYYSSSDNSLDDNNYGDVSSCSL